MPADRNILKIKGLRIIQSGKELIPEFDLQLKYGEHLAIIGAAGSGKTSLAMALSGRMHFQGSIEYDPSIQKIAWVEQQHHFRNRSNTQSFYYQQRFNSFDADDALTVTEYLQTTSEDYRQIVEQMQIEYLLGKPLIQLSNGENKKVQLALALLSQPDSFVLDQPFVGLDTATRKYLHELLNKLAAEGKLIIIVTQPNEIPGCITQVLTLTKDSVPAIETKENFISNAVGPISEPVIDKEELLQLVHPASVTNEIIVQLEHINVSYGEKKVLTDLSWEIKQGECWLLSGPNGAGKSTLLSLITADNPQAYSNTIYLFGKRRGSGETIWDIKKQIGFLSPELHLFFDQGSSVFEAIASGLFDTIGLFRQLSDEQIDLVNSWIRLMGIHELAGKPLFQLSLGEQRKILLTRALIKDPPLLILDEPCQGLDDESEAELLRIIDEICIAGKKTLIYVSHYADKIPACISRTFSLMKT